MFITGCDRAGGPTSFEQAQRSKPVNDEQLFGAITGIISRPRKIFHAKTLMLRISTLGVGDGSARRPEVELALRRCSELAT
jgi:hypothetical protein